MRKKGVSLIVLVITIIVMLILASAVAVSLNNANVIESAKNAVCKTNLKEVQEIANVAWVEAYGLGERDQTKLKDAVDKALADSKIDLTPYDINVTLDGVTVIGTGCADIANPDNNNGTQVAKDWTYAYTYSASAGWSSKITNVGEEPTGDIVVKLYKTGAKVTPSLAGTTMEKVTFTEGDGYKMVVSGDGAIPATLDGTTGTMSVWTNNVYSYIMEQMQSETKTIVADEAFYVTELVIEEGIDSIGSYDFFCFVSLTDVTIPTSVKTIDANAFDGDMYIEQVNYDGTYEDWNNITIGSNNTYLTEAIGLDWEYAYTYSESSGWSGKIVDNFKEPTGDVIVRLYKTGEKVTPTDGTNTYSSGDGYKMVITGKGSMGDTIMDFTDEANPVFYAWGEQVSNIANSINQGLTPIEEIMYVTEVEIGEGVTNIPDYMFIYFISLKNLSMPTTIKTIGIASFGATAIEELTIPSGTTTIEEEAFSSCMNLKTVKIPKSVTTIVKEAFYNCSAIETVYYEGSETDWNAIIIGNYNKSLTGANIVYNYSE